MPVFPDRARHRLRTPLSCTPYVYDLAVRLRPSRRPDLARPGSALTIEGYLRSGNTFAVAAFTLGNGTDHHIGRHLHAAAHVHRSVRLGLPTVVVVREPVAAASSYLIRRPTLDAAGALREYVAFHRSVWRARGSVVLAPFEVVVSDFGEVVRAVNHRFGTAFVPYVPTPENQAACFRIVEEMNRSECGGEVVETHVARPSAERDRQGRALRATVEAPHCARLLNQARELHRRFLAEASVMLRTPEAGRCAPSSA